MCHPTYNTAEDLDKGVRILNRRLETNTFSSQKENELIKEINQIKNSKPTIEKITKLRSRIQELRQAQRQDTESLPQLNRKLDGIR